MSVMLINGEPSYPKMSVNKGLSEKSVLTCQTVLAPRCQMLEIFELAKTLKLKISRMFNVS